MMERWNDGKVELTPRTSDSAPSPFLMLIPTDRIEKLAFSFRMETNKHLGLFRFEKLRPNFLPRAAL
jgi:hypothetical protein